MDVLAGPSRFPLPPFHDLYAHACAVLPRILRPLLHTALQTTSGQHIESSQRAKRGGDFQTQRTSDDRAILSYPDWTLRCSYRSGYRAWKYVTEVYHTHLLQ